MGYSYDFSKYNKQKDEYQEQKNKKKQNYLYNLKKNSIKSILLKEISYFNNSKLNFRSELKDFKNSLISKLEDSLFEISNKKISKRKVGHNLIETHKDIMKYNEIIKECLKNEHTHEDFFIHIGYL